MDNEISALCCCFICHRWTWTKIDGWMDRYIYIDTLLFQCVILYMITSLSVNGQLRCDRYLKHSETTLHLRATPLSTWAGILLFDPPSLLQSGKDISSPFGTAKHLLIIEYSCIHLPFGRGTVAMAARDRRLCFCRWACWERERLNVIDAADALMLLSRLQSMWTTAWSFGSHFEHLFQRVRRSTAARNSLSEVELYSFFLFYCKWIVKVTVYPLATFLLMTTTTYLICHPLWKMHLEFFFSMCAWSLPDSEFWPLKVRIIAWLSQQENDQLASHIGTQAECRLPSEQDWVRKTPPELAFDRGQSRTAGHWALDAPSCHSLSLKVLERALAVKPDQIYQRCETLKLTEGSLWT